MLNIPVQSPLGFLGVFGLIGGFFLILAGLEIIKINQISVSGGRKTWGSGLLLAMLGTIFLVLEGSLDVASTLQAASSTNPVYESSNFDPSPVGLNLKQLKATATHNPPQIDDLLVVRFTLKNESESAIQLSHGSFFLPVDPAGTEIFVSRQHDSKWIQPGEEIVSEGSVELNRRGTWTIMPCYELAEKDGEDRFCPPAWNQFVVTVQ